MTGISIRIAGRIACQLGGSGMGIGYLRLHVESVGLADGLAAFTLETAGHGTMAAQCDRYQH
jgi:hypothetical protein